MADIKINLQEPYLSFLLNGQKTIEVRLCRGKFAKLKSKDKITINNVNQQFEVVKIKKYNSFFDLVNNEDIKSIAPDKKRAEDIVALYHNFYTPAQEEEFGVIAIELNNYFLN